jgi:hypothetical protein
MIQNRWSLLLLGIVVWVSVDSAAAALRQEKESSKEQEVHSFEVVVLDRKGEPVKDAVVKPWAIGSSQGHGMWNEKATGGVKAESVITDSSGKATIRYPKFDDLAEEVRSTMITVSIDHPDHPYTSSEHVEVPLDKIHQVLLPVGSPIEVAVLLDGERVTGDEIKTLWSDGNSTADRLMIDEAKATIRIPPLPVGKGEFMMVRLDGDVITHFTAIEKVKIGFKGKLIEREIELIPAKAVRGKLSDNVPRPVVNGRVKMQTISDGRSWSSVSWSDWAEVSEDGTFEIPAWPHDQPMQLIALSDGFIGKSGEKPSMVSERRARGDYWRAQVFMTPHEEDPVVEMEPMVECRFEFTNSFEKELADVTVTANPNIGWWNGGSQIYCSPLWGTADYMRLGKFVKQEGGIHTLPFRGTTDEKGVVTIDLPAGDARIWARNERYQMAATLGDRSKKLMVEVASPPDLKLVLQPRGLDVLGDWEDLCGLVFG